MSLVRRATYPLAIVTIVALPLFLSGCGNPVAAPPPPTATPIPATATPAPPTDTPASTDTPGPSATPTVPPTPTPIPIGAQSRAAPFPDADQYSGGSPAIAIDARVRKVTTFTGGILRIVGVSSGRVTGPMTATTDTGSARFTLDGVHDRAAVLVDSPYGVSPTLTIVDVGTGRQVVQRTLRGVPQANARDFKADPTDGGLLVSTEGAGGFDGGLSPELLRLSSDGVVQQTRAISVDATLYLDARDRVVVAEGLSTEGGPVLAGYDARTLAPLWKDPAPYDPKEVTVDPTHGRVWLLAEGGRVTILDARTGRTIETCDPSYKKPEVWEGNNDLVVDPVSGVGYTSERAGTSYSDVGTWIDRIDPATKVRDTLTLTGGAVGAALARSGRLVTLDDQGDMVLRNPTSGRVVATVVSGATFNGAGSGSSTSDFSGVSIVQSGATVVIARAATVAYQNNVTGSTSTPGVILATFHDRL